jgi:hypothetical protein
MLKAAGRFFNSDTSMWILVAIVVVVLVWALMSYSGNKSNRVRDAFGGGNGAQPNQPASSLAAASQPLASISSPPPSTTTAVPPPPSSLQARPTLQPSDIVLNPVNVPDLIMSPQAFIGVDTISNWLKNPSYDLRSDPIIPKQDVGPWNNSTFSPDLMRRPFELDCGQR